MSNQNDSEFDWFWGLLVWGFILSGLLFKLLKVIWNFLWNVWNVISEILPYMGYGLLGIVILTIAFQIISFVIREYNRWNKAKKYQKSIMGQIDGKHVEVRSAREKVAKEIKQTKSKLDKLEQLNSGITSDLKIKPHHQEDLEWISQVKGKYEDAISMLNYHKILLEKHFDHFAKTLNGLDTKKKIAEYQRETKGFTDELIEIDMLIDDSDWFIKHGIDQWEVNYDLLENAATTDELSLQELREKIKERQLEEQFQYAQTK